jgi:hypothetical protein
MRSTIQLIAPKAREIYRIHRFEERSTAQKVLTAMYLKSVTLMSYRVRAFSGGIAIGLGMWLNEWLGSPTKRLTFRGPS